VNQRDVAAVERLVEVEVFELVSNGVDGGKCSARVVDRLFAVVGQEVSDAPRVERLEDAYVVSAARQLGDDASQKVGVSVVPVAEERMAKKR
jgi:hypothetical protein